MKEHLVKRSPCRSCIRHFCMNRGTAEANEEHNKCYLPSKCSACSYFRYCQNINVGRIPNESEEISQESGNPSCFVSPKCGNTCPLGTGHCKNRDLPGSEFSWDPRNRYPSCFSGSHSTK